MYTLPSHSIYDIKMKSQLFSKIEERLAKEMRLENEKRSPSSGLRDKLLARRSPLEKLRLGVVVQQES